MMRRTKRVIKKEEKPTGSDRYIHLPVPDFLPSSIQKGRKITWKPEFIRHAYFYALAGFTDVQMAQAFDTSVATVDKWKRVIPEFLQAMHEGKMMADADVAHSLYKAAVGYEHEEEVILPNKIREFDSKGKPIREHTEPLRVKTIKRYPPNVNAGIKWLTVRQPEVWGNRVHVEGTINHNHKIDLSKFSTEELEVLNRIGLQQGQKNVEDVDFEEQG